MLTGPEQRRLTEIERGLQAEDPEFVERFGQVPRSSPWRWRGLTARGWLIAAALTLGLAALTASPALALLGLSVAGVSAGWWLTRRGSA
jgi:hypothetical protein